MIVINCKISWASAFNAKKIREINASRFKPMFHYSVKDHNLSKLKCVEHMDCDIGLHFKIACLFIPFVAVSYP